ncbi:xanthine dehydrogenase family protein molybdopterin-binding subunit [Flavitalea flava]
MKKKDPAKDNGQQKGNLQLNRRDFLKTGAFVGGGLVIAFVIPTILKRLASQHAAGSSGEVFTPNAFLRIGEDDQIQIILSKVEMGQGVWTTLPMLMAEELDCDWSKIRVEHSPPGKEKDFTEQPILKSTGGSMTTTSQFDLYREAGATARTMLVQAAAKRWGVSPDACHTENGYVIYRDPAGNNAGHPAGSNAGGKDSIGGKGKRFRYGELVAEASKLPVPTVKLREPKEWKIIGKSQRRLDSPEKVNGQAIFGIDIRFPGLLIAVVAHPPVFGGKVRTFDATKAKLVPGVREVVQMSSGIAVLADHYWAAKLGRDALTIDWDLGNTNEHTDTKRQWEEYRKLSATRGLVTQQKGEVTKALGKMSSPIIDREFRLPYLAHSPMEPLNCTVKLEGDKCEIWAGTQSPLLHQAEVAGFLGIKPEKVLLHTPFLGGSFGRRGSFQSDWVMEAVRIAKISGRVIKLVWSREDDIKGGYYRPAYLHQVRVGIGKDGYPVAWQHRIVGQSLFVNTPLESMIVQKGIDYSSVDGVQGSPYLTSVPDHTVELHTTTLDVPVLPWRSVGNSHTAFVMESLIDELAFMAGKDPVDYRIVLLKEHPRHLAALKLAAEKSDWGKPLPVGRFQGVAVHGAMGSFVCQVVELSVTDRKIRIHRVVCAIDCGLAVNPDGVRAQMESGIVFGLTAALYGEITLENGQIKQSNFHDYRMLRMNEMPFIEVQLVPGTEKMGGAGEPGVPPIAPALVNALFAATGKRIRNLPVKMEELV